VAILALSARALGRDACGAQSLAQALVADADAVLTREQLLQVAVIDAPVLLRDQLQHPPPELVVRLVGWFAPAPGAEQPRETLLSGAHQ